MTMGEFKMSIEGVYKRPILRQSKEGISIKHTLRDIERGKKVVLMNSKSEFHQPGIVRASYNPVFRQN